MSVKYKQDYGDMLHDIAVKNIRTNRHKNASHKKISQNIYGAYSTDVERARFRVCTFSSSTVRDSLQRGRRTKRNWTKTAYCTH